MKREPWRERWIRPDTKGFIDDIIWSVIGIIVGLGLVGVINGIYALCEWLKTVNIS